MSFRLPHISQHTTLLPHPGCSAVAQMNEIVTNPIYRALSNDVGQLCDVQSMSPSAPHTLCTNAMDGRGQS
ncbi:uncharacterized protein LACBIDRAFT_314290 [Laccaria bicolor S238N-H82]|uniref:Predicted protein n=1 Tax=Laccaria bicolor (strain S238N-H82 / ATCC MYA-4686) TaxID=486041 RepID=B0D208_LACBS|nr:uncharacterized protein LACBIDRAFT_314290 [Laccaria bicolor S238N-H82]EDR12083.1 predicted protein [Laccaria bicolor S238N-H82]|eukprot:XP_001877980.1 predicted protein [Laccaria bicolor S238N-H82]